MARARTTRRRSPKRARAVRGTAAVGATKRRRRRVSGTAAVGAVKHRRRRIGATSGAAMGKQIIPLAIGMAAGVGVQHFLLRPIEQKISEHMPMAAKFMAAGEILLGGAMFLKAKNSIVKGVGLGIMAGGVNTAVKQLNIYHESPAVNGSGDYMHTRIPINGIVMNDHNSVDTKLVAGLSDEMDQVLPPKVGVHNRYYDNPHQGRTNLLAGVYGLY